MTTARFLRHTRYNPRIFHHERSAHSPAEETNFTSLVDNGPDIVRSGRRHGPGIIVLALIPITAFALGTWQVFRLGWKTELITKFEDRLIKPPLPLPPRIDPDAIKDFDYRKVFVAGRLRHDQEMLIGPRIHDGSNGYLVVTPLEREDGGSTVLINRGWIPKNKKGQADRPEGLPQGQVMIEGLLREPWKKNVFTPDNQPEKGQFYFPDVKQMADLAGCEAVWIEETMTPDLLKAYDREAKGIPVGRPAEVNLRNNHTQYIFTWSVNAPKILHLFLCLQCLSSFLLRYALSAATAVMLWIVVRKPPSEVTRRIRQNKSWR
ncbi:MAG: hypothetical protein Q9222_000168 [Ikaeria aurantiellina]